MKPRRPLALLAVATALGPSLPEEPRVETRSVYFVSVAGNDSRTCLSATDASTPRRTIRAGLACAGAGDTVEVLAGAYVESLTSPGDWPSGTPDRRVVLRARPGDRVVWRSAAERPTSLAGFAHIRDASWIRVEGFVFESSTTQHCFVVENTTADRIARPVLGIEIIGNTFRDNGHQETDNRPACLLLLKVGPEAPDGHPGALVRGNTFDGNTGFDVNVRASTDVEIVANEMTRGRAGFLTASGEWSHRGIFVAGETRSPHGTIANRRIILRKNHIHDFAGRDADPRIGAYRTEGIKGDVDADSVLVEGNVIHDLPERASAAIFVEARCDHWTIRDNLIYRVGEGIRVGSRPTTVSVGNEVASNTLYAVNGGVVLDKAQAAAVHHNIAWCTGRSACVVQSDSSIAYGGNVWLHNLWRHTGRRDGLIGAWGGTPHSRRPNLRCAEWLGSAGERGSLCDLDPLFVNVAKGVEDFRLRPGSPALAAGDGGADLGARRVE